MEFVNRVVAWHEKADQESVWYPGSRSRLHHRVDPVEMAKKLKLDFKRSFQIETQNKIMCEIFPKLSRQMDFLEGLKSSHSLKSSSHAAMLSIAK